LDAARNPVGPSVLKLETHSPFSSLPPETIDANVPRDFSTPADNEVRVPAPGRPAVELPPVSLIQQDRTS
jgi:hypothetical protein